MDKHISDPEIRSGFRRESRRAIASQFPVEKAAELEENRGEDSRHDRHHPIAIIPRHFRPAEPCTQQPGPHAPVAWWMEYGLVTAGLPDDRFDATNRRIDSIQDLVPGIRPGDFFLVVRGDSMIDAGLQPGQYVVIRPEMPQRDGEICAVWVEGSGATLKRVYFDMELIRLVPANPSYAVQIYPASEVQIQGVLVAALAIQSYRR